MVHTSGQPETRHKGFQILRTHSSESEKQEDDLRWSYKHKSEISEEYQKQGCGKKTYDKNADEYFICGNLDNAFIPSRMYCDECKKDSLVKTSDVMARNVGLEASTI